MQNTISPTMNDTTTDTASEPLASEESLATDTEPTPATTAKPSRPLTIAEEIDALTDPSFMTSLARGLAVVKAFSDQRRAMTIAQLSHKKIGRAHV